MTVWCVVFCVMTPCNLIGSYQHTGNTTLAPLV